MRNMNTYTAAAASNAKATVPRWIHTQVKSVAPQRMKSEELQVNLMSSYQHSQSCVHCKMMYGNYLLSGNPSVFVHQVQPMRQHVSAHGRVPLAYQQLQHRSPFTMALLSQHYLQIKTLRHICKYPRPSPTHSAPPPLLETLLK